MILIQGNAPGVVTELVLSRNQLNSRLLLKSCSTALLAQRNTCFGSIYFGSIEPERGVLVSASGSKISTLRFDIYGHWSFSAWSILTDLDALPRVYLLLRGGNFTSRGRNKYIHWKQYFSTSRLYCLRVFHNSRLMRRIEQDEITKKNLETSPGIEPRSLA